MDKAKEELHQKFGTCFGESMSSVFSMLTGRDFAMTTQAGKVLEGYVHRVIALLEEAREAIGELKGLQRGHLHIGASTTPGVYLLPRIIGAFKARYPGIEVFLEIANTRQVGR